MWGLPIGKIIGRVLVAGKESALETALNVRLLVALLESGGHFLVFQRLTDGKLMLPFHVPSDPDDAPLVAMNQFLCGLGWDFSVSTCIGPWGLNLSDIYFHLHQDGATGWAPKGWVVTWMTIHEIGEALNKKRFIRPTLVDRALSLYASYGSS